MSDAIMPLTEALNILAECHTRPDDLAGFVVMHGGGPRYGGFTQPEYTHAWESVLHALGRLPASPTPSDTPPSQVSGQ